MSGSSVEYGSAEIPISLRVNQFIAGAQVSFPTKQPEVLKSPRKCNAK